MLERLYRFLYGVTLIITKEPFANNAFNILSIMKVILLEKEKDIAI